MTHRPPLRPSPIPFRSAGWFLGAVFLVAAASQAKLQLFEAKSTVALGERTNRFTRVVTNPARRGTILTSDGRPLAEDSGTYGLTLVYNKVPRVPAFYTELAAASGIPAPELAPPTPTTKVRSWPGPIPASASVRVREVQRRWRADGVSMRAIGARSYPAGWMASGIVGLQRPVPRTDDAGRIVPAMMRTGLEASRQSDLQGHDGRESGLTDRNGLLLPLRTNNDRVDRRDGADVVTTLDSSLQATAAKAIRGAVERNRADQGVAIVLDPATGDILAMANWPSFDPAAGASDGRPVGLNPAYRDQLYPGSTFKILTLAMAMDAGKVTMQTVVNCPGEIVVGKHNIHCDHSHGPSAHGPITPVTAIAKSCNISAANWAGRIGRDRFLDYVERLGLMKKSELGLPGEIGGNYNKAETAKALQLATFGFGQSMTLTPIALAGAFGTLANDGVRVEPRLVRRIGEKVLTPLPGARVFKSETCRDVRQAMEAVIETDAGTGKGLRIPGYRLAGKTGTAERQRRGQSGYVASFVGLVPARAPRAVILVMVDHPKGDKYYGSQVAGPVFQTLAQSVIDRYRIPPDAPVVAVNARPKGSLSSQ